MKNIKDYLFEASNVKITNKDIQNWLDEKEREALDFYIKKYNSNKEMVAFFQDLKKYKGSQYQSPMKNNSIYVCMGTDAVNEYSFQQYDNIFIQLNGPAEKYALFFDGNDKIAIATKIRTSYSEESKDSGCFLQEDGSFSGKSSSITWLDFTSDAVTDVLSKF